MKARQHQGQKGYHQGRVAEDLVASDYERRGRIEVARRWRGSCGEIDLILRDGAGYVFVEVKSSRTSARAAQRLSRRQMDRICGAASEFVARSATGQLTEMRFDLALVDGAGRVDVIENAFMEGW